MSQENNELLTFGGHLEVLRQMLFRVLGVVAVIAVVVFCFKDTTWRLLLAPSEWDFCTYRWLERAMQAMGFDFRFEEFHVSMIATDLSSQFMTHITTAVYLGLLGASPYILYELFRFISPALYENERHGLYRAVTGGSAMFVLGLLFSYFVVFPLTFRFLGTYQVSADLQNLITIQSYIDTMLSLTLALGIVFEVPVVCWLLAQTGILKPHMMSQYRRHAVVVILIVAAIITPTQDVFTLLIVSLPIWLLYEASIWIVRVTGKKAKE